MNLTLNIGLSKNSRISSGKARPILLSIGKDRGTFEFRRFNPESAQGPKWLEEKQCTTLQDVARDMQHIRSLAFDTCLRERAPRSRGKP